VGIRANWFVDDLATAVEPPPKTPVEPAEGRIEDVGVPLDLSDPDAFLSKITRLVQQEAALYNQGITCDVKDRPDTACTACPVAHHEQEGHPMQPLCWIGREQERICTAHAHLKAR
jgi:hypothetical protein